MKKYIDLSKYDSKLTIGEVLTQLIEDKENLSSLIKSKKEEYNNLYFGKYFKYNIIEETFITKCYFKVKKIELYEGDTYKVLGTLIGDSLVIDNSGIYVNSVDFIYINQINSLNDFTEISEQEYQKVIDECKKFKEKLWKD